MIIRRVDGGGNEDVNKRSAAAAASMQFRKARDLTRPFRLPPSRYSFPARILSGFLYFVLESSQRLIAFNPE
jgi:hypothetical protein